MNNEPVSVSEFRANFNQYAADQGRPDLAVPSDVSDDAFLAVVLPTLPGHVSVSIDSTGKKYLRGVSLKR